LNTTTKVARLRPRAHLTTSCRRWCRWERFL